MRLSAPCQGINFRTKDVHGKPFQLSDYKGKRVMLSFFRDAGCPFCNLRVYELTHKYKHWQDQNLEVIAVFSDTSAQVRRYVAKHPRPFTMLADPKLQLYNRYGIEHSGSALLKALLFKFPRIVKGIFKGGRPSNNPHVKIVPADFLLTEDGRVAKVWYGRDTSDHIPLTEVQRFIDEGRLTPSVSRAS
ncbi:peroxiredoxin family protein [Gilvimarinus japonicus]|uniref:Peroxiredoxin family protein n=1 Tax=Gilvimarinus japonicus TaxID=1796469 RepID=A0ABV7HT28_9GAMM